MDPFMVLGVPHTATKAEVKAAFRWGGQWADAPHTWKPVAVG